MKREPTFDFFVVARQHLEIHDRLCNWARWCYEKGASCTSPMFRQYRSSEIWAQDQTSFITDPLDGHRLEKAVSALPEKHRDAIRWQYVYSRIPPNRMCKHLAVTRVGLVQLVTDGRQMLKNRTNAPDKRVFG